VSGADPTEPPPVSPRQLLAAVFSATFFVRFGFGLTISIFASYILGRSSGLDTSSVGVVGLISAMAPVGEFTTVLFSGIAADRYGRFPVLLTGMIGAAALLAVVSLTRNAFALGSMNLFFGVSSGAILAASLAVVADQAEPQETGYEMGRFDAVNLLGWIGGFAVGFGLLGTISNSNLVWVFRAGAVLLTLGVIFTIRLIRGHREPPLRSQFDLRAIVESVRRRGVLLVTLPWFVIYMLLGVGFVFLGTASTGLGVSPVVLAAVIGGGGTILLATQPYFGRLADRFGRMRLMAVGTAGFVSVLVCAGLLQTFGPQPALLAATGVSALVGLGYGPAALAALADLSLLFSRATTMAIYTLTISLGMFVGLGVSTSLYSTFGAIGLDGFFAGVGVALVALTYSRYLETRATPGA
jgi:MFS family permease